MLDEKTLVLIVLLPIFGLFLIISLLYCIMKEVVCPKM